MYSREYRTIKSEDVGVPIFAAFGRSQLVSNFMGRILARDVGKRVYLVGGIFQVENDQQWAERIRREGDS